MRQYLAFFKLRFITNLQYRSAAIAGILTQFFFGFVFVLVYIAFYESNVTDAPMKLNELISYVWLGQSFFSLTYLYYRDKDIISMIQNGNVSYELCRPGNLYFKWFFRIMAAKSASILLKFLPVILITLLLPNPYRLQLPISLPGFLAFFISLIISLFLTSSIITIAHLVAFALLDEKGVYTILMSIADIFSGAIIPLPFFPKYLKIIADILPFRYVSDLAYRLYIGNINVASAPLLITIQLIWTIVFILMGYFLTKKIVNNIVIQGG